MKITDKDRIDFIEKYQVSINHRGGATSSMIKWAIHSFYQQNYGETLREAIDKSITEMENRND